MEAAGLVLLVLPARVCWRVPAAGGVGVVGLSAGCGGCLVRLVCAGWFLVGWLWCGGRVLCAACVLRCVCGCCGVRGVCWLPVAVCWCVRVCVCWWGRGGWWGCAVGFWGGASRWWLCRGWLVACCCLPLVVPAGFLAGGAAGWVVGGWWLAGVGGLVVICIVDASIFVLCVVIVVVFVWVVLCVCFFGRSVDALASGADEGRGGLR